MHKAVTDNLARDSLLTKRHAVVAFVIGGIIALILAELAVRIFLPHPAHFLGHPANVPGLVAQHGLRGYSWSPGFEGRMTSNDFSNSYVISSQGLRDDFVEDDSALRILAIGDSFTGGEGVEAHESWPKQLELLQNRSQRTRVINAGVTGYSARQMRLMAEELVPVFEPEHVIIGVFTQGYDRVEDPFTLVGTHLVKQSEVPNMRLLDNGYIWWHQSEFKSAAAAEFEKWCQNYWHFGAYVIRLIHRLRQAQDVASTTISEIIPAAKRLEPVFSELRLLSRFLNSRDISLSVLVINRQGSNGTFSIDKKALASAVREFGEAAGIEVIDPTAVLESQAQGRLVFRFENDGHWTPLAHSAVAAEIVKSTQRTE